MRLSTTFINQTGLSSILEQQSQLFRTQQQVASGRRILSPSDDPSGSSQILRLTQTIDVTQQYQENADIAGNRLALEESTIKSAQESLVRVKELALQGNNATLSNSDRLAIAQEVRERLNELLGLANTRDANQEYLFSGYKVTTQPFIQNPNGTFSYLGDQGQRQIQISSGRQVNDSHSGTEVFTNVLNGNGRFQTLDNVANTGTGVISPGQVTDNSIYVEDTYTITFVTNGAGNLGYNVVGANSGQVIPTLPQNPVTNAPDYSSGASIAFNGLSTEINGTPVAGDTFTISPSVKQNVFTTVDNLVNALERNNVTASDESKVNNQITRAIVDIDQAIDNLIRVRTDIGARLNTIDDQKETNTSFIFELESTLSETRDIDLTSAVVELQSRLVAFEAAQASYARIQNLSLFNVI